MGEAIVVLIVVLGLLWVGRTWLRNRTEERLSAGQDDKSAESETTRPNAQRAPVTEFHVVGSEARVTFDVPLDDEDDEVLNEILLDEAVEVLREKRHTLPIGDVHEVVVFAGRGQPREVARTKLPSPGVLPPPPPVSLLHLGNVAHDPFASDAEPQAATYETVASVPEDDLPPIGKELRIPKGLDRGLRAAGVDVSSASGPEIIVGLMKLFGYLVEASPEPGVFNAVKDGETTMVVVEGYSPGDHPEVDEKTIRGFAGRFSMSGANRGVFVSEKYAPYMIYELERNEPRLRFITRERLQDFIDSMAMS